MNNRPCLLSLCLLILLPLSRPAYPDDATLVVRFVPAAIEAPQGRTSGSIYEFNFTSETLRNALIEEGVEHLTRLFPHFSSGDRNSTNLIGEPIELEDLSEFYLVTVSAPNRQGANERLRVLRGITYADWIKHGGVLSPVYPDDDYFDKQWGLNNDSTLTLCPTYSGPDPVVDTDINAPEA